MKKICLWVYLNLEQTFVGWSSLHIHCKVNFLIKLNIPIAAACLGESVLSSYYSVSWGAPGQLWGPQVTLQSWDALPDRDGALAGKLSQRHFQEEDGDPSDAQHGQVWDQEGPWEKREGQLKRSSQHD